jgi:hypothetical protein
VRGEVSRLRISYFITYIEGETGFYQVICWSLESTEAATRPLFEKIANSFREKVQGNWSVKYIDTIPDEVRRGSALLNDATRNSQPVTRNP